MQHALLASIAQVQQVTLKLTVQMEHIQLETNPLVLCVHWDMNVH